MKGLFNGQPATALAFSRGLHYGDGVFSTLLIWDGKPLDWDLQMEKLGADCAALALRMPDAGLLYAEAIRFAAGEQRAVMKIMVMRQAGGRGYRAMQDDSDRLLLVYPAPSYPSRLWQSGIAAFFPAFRLAAQPELAGLKHLNRLEQVLASRQWPEHADEGILCDQAGFLVSGTRSNLFWVRDGQLLTPSTQDAGVSGMMRKKIMKLGVTMGVSTAVVQAPSSSLLEADEAFVCNSLIGIWPLRQCAARTWRDAPGRLTSDLIDALRHPRLD